MRYAVYLTPPKSSPLWRAGAAWLGRDPARNPLTGRPLVAGISNDRFVDLTRDARRYGFHGTLKAPFPLAAGLDAGALVAKLDSFAALRRPFVLEAVSPRLLSGFLALQPVAYDQRLADLAADTVRVFDPFRARLTESERNRRLAQNLTPAQIALLDSWGYPYVMEEFSFHLTLSARMTEAEQAPLMAAAQAHFSPYLQDGFAVEGLSLFVEEKPGADFQFLRWFPFNKG